MKNIAIIGGGTKLSDSQKMELRRYADMYAPIDEDEDDRYEEGYADGYAEGTKDTLAELECDCDEDCVQDRSRVLTFHLFRWLWACGCA